jgi:hypothetical protein
VQLLSEHKLETRLVISLSQLAVDESIDVKQEELSNLP